MVAVRLVARLAPRITRRGRTRGTVVVASVAGNTHALASMLVATVLRGAGFTVIELGGDTPPEVIVAAAQRADRLIAVALSVSTDAAHPAARRAARAVRATLPWVPVCIGGPAVLSEQTATELGGDRWAARADELAEQLATLLHDGPPFGS